MVPITDLFALRQAMTLFADPLTIQSQNMSEHYLMYLVTFKSYCLVLQLNLPHMSFFS